MSQNILHSDGYFRHPTIHKEKIAFICEADIWLTSIDGGNCQRITQQRVNASWPHFSPDGSKIAFVSNEELGSDVYVLDVASGMQTRLTYYNSRNLIVVGWQGNKVVLSCDEEQPFFRQNVLRSVSLDKGLVNTLPYGHAGRLSLSSEGHVALCRHEQDLARWKRYRGGRAGALWVRQSKEKKFRRILEDLQGNIANPQWLGERIYFLSDYEGHSQVYSCDALGASIKCHTDHQDFYPRALNSDGTNLVYQCGGEIYVLQPKSNTTKLLDIDYTSSKPQLVKKFCAPQRYIESHQSSPSTNMVCLTVRGKIFNFAPWEGEITQLGERQGVRYRLASYTYDSKGVICISDEDGEERLCQFNHFELGSYEAQKKIFSDIDLGHVSELVCSPTENLVAVCNQRCELFLVNLDSGAASVLDKGLYSEVSDVSFSPDGKWITYSCAKHPNLSQIYIADVKGGDPFSATDPVGQDFSPSFSQDGKYLFFLSSRSFDPVYDCTRFDLGFPKDTKPYALCLEKQTPSPFVHRGDDEKKNDKEKSDRTIEVKVDQEGICSRVLAFPVSSGRYQNLKAADGKVFYLDPTVEGSLKKEFFDRSKATTLKAFNLKALEEEVFCQNVSDYVISQGGKKICYLGKDKLRYVNTATKPDNKTHQPTPKSGWIDLNRIRISIEPRSEWQQMYRELWRLQRDHYWDPKMAQIDWRKIYDQYLPLLDKVATRLEFSDLIWEVHGELGTSHAYEMGGDTERGKPYKSGSLGADLKWDSSGCWIITNIAHGDTWIEDASSPLSQPGICLAEGDKIWAIDGIEASENLSPQELLHHHAQKKVSLVVERVGSTQKEKLVIKPLASDRQCRYRQWVNERRQLTRELSKSRVGYIHVPNMGPTGYSEFFRSLLLESECEALIVDVRNNAGGHVSQLLLEKLRRRAYSYHVSHSLSPSPTPSYSSPEVMICVTNENAGSDGDIFSHSFKLLGLGPLLGKRTWGGVVGINMKSFLVDNTLVTQPEYATWFKDVGWNIENYGATPDIELDLSPDDIAQGNDAQLIAGIYWCIKELEKRPKEKPDFADKPNLSKGAL